MLCVKIIKIFLINLYIQATIFFCGVKNERKKELFLNGVMLTFDCKDGLYNIYDNKNNFKR